MNEILISLQKWIKPELALKGLAALVVGYIVAKLLSSLVGRAARKASDSHTGAIASKIVYYLVMILAIVLMLDLFNVKLTGILAAAGIISVALGFAAQTSVSNIVSGLFLLWDRPFQLDDVIEVEKTMGTVTDIGLLSTKLRTFDNLYVRIPNETLVKNKLVNYTRFKTRRLSISFHIAEGADIATAKKVILQQAMEYQHALPDPKPFVVVQGMDESGVRLEVFLWVPGEAYLQSLSDQPFLPRRAHPRPAGRGRVAALGRHGRHARRHARPVRAGRPPRPAARRSCHLQRR